MKKHFRATKKAELHQRVARCRKVILFATACHSTGMNIEDIGEVVSYYEYCGSIMQQENLGGAKNNDKIDKRTFETFYTNVVEPMKY